MTRKESGPCIYAIRCKNTGKLFICGSVNPEQAITSFFMDLKRGRKMWVVDGRRVNSPIQDDYNKFGEDAFEVYILEEKMFDSAMRRERKKHWINEYKANDPRFGYNETKFEKKLAVSFVCGLPPKKCENMEWRSSNVEDAE